MTIILAWKFFEFMKSTRPTQFPRSSCSNISIEVVTHRALTANEEMELEFEDQLYAHMPDDIESSR